VTIEFNKPKKKKKRKKKGISQNIFFCVPQKKESQVWNNIVKL